MFVDRVRAGERDAPTICIRAGAERLATGIVPVPNGHPLMGTGDVGADVALVAPEVFRAVTVKRSALFTSTFVIV